jgi:hypothetical protein
MFGCTGTIASPSAAAAAATAAAYNYCSGGDSQSLFINEETKAHKFSCLCLHLSKVG